MGVVFWQRRREVRTSFHEWRLTYGQIHPEMYPRSAAVELLKGLLNSRCVYYARRLLFELTLFMAIGTMPPLPLLDEGLQCSRWRCLHLYALIFSY